MHYLLSVCIISSSVFSVICKPVFSQLSSLNAVDQTADDVVMNPTSNTNLIPGDNSELTDSGLSNDIMEVAINILPENPNACESTLSSDNKSKITSCEVDYILDVFTCTGSPEYRCSRKKANGDNLLYYRNCPENKACELCPSFKAQGPDNCGPIPQGLDIFP